MPSFFLCRRMGIADELPSGGCRATRAYHRDNVEGMGHQAANEGVANARSGVITIQSCEYMSGGRNLLPKFMSISFFIGNGRGTVGKRTGPKWSKMSKRPFWSKWPYSELDFSIRETKMDQNGPFLVHFGLKRPILVHLGPPTVLSPFLISGVYLERNLWNAGSFLSRLQECISFLRRFRQKWRTSVLALFS